MWFSSKPTSGQSKSDFRQSAFQNKSIRPCSPNGRPPYSLLPGILRDALQSRSPLKIHFVLSSHKTSDCLQSCPTCTKWRLQRLVPESIKCMGMMLQAARPHCWAAAKGQKWVPEKEKEVDMVSSLPVYRCIDQLRPLLHALGKWVRIIRSELSLSWEKIKKRQKTGPVKRSVLELCHLNHVDYMQDRALTSSL